MREPAYLSKSVRIKVYPNTRYVVFCSVQTKSSAKEVPLFAGILWSQQGSTVEKSIYETGFEPLLFYLRTREWDEAN